jgi:alkyldihydroxyacetonephosphate synthase
MREKSFWGWGYQDAFPDDDGRRALGEMAKLLLGLESVELLPLPRIDAIELSEPRKRAPEGLPITSERTARISHTYGRAYGDLIRGFGGDFANAPDLVATPESEDQVRQILDWCDESGVAVVPYGGGTSVVRGVECPRDRADAVLSLDLAKLDRVLEIDRTSRLARIQAGATGPELEAALAQEGLTLRCYPQSFEHSTLGGWIATRAGGHFATLYTHVDDLVASTRTLTPRGTIETRLLPASGAGPSADRLILGSEGTLGVITEAWMRVRPRPLYKLSASVRFSELSAAVRAARELAQSGLHPSNCRLLDPAEAALNKVVEDGSSVLIVAFESDDHPLEAWMSRALEICEGAGGKHRGAKDRSQEGESWKAAFVQAPYLQTALVSLGILADTFETACTWSRFEELHAALGENVRRALVETGGGGTLTCRFTHVYPDGPAPYYTFVTKAERGGELAQWAAIKAAAADTLMAHGATITHHHAVGRTHRPWYEQEVPALYREILRSAKRVVDPQGLMNPGVLVEP